MIIQGFPVAKLHAAVPVTARERVAGFFILLSRFQCCQSHQKIIFHQSSMTWVVQWTVVFWELQKLQSSLQFLPLALSPLQPSLVSIRPHAVSIDIPIHMMPPLLTKFHFSKINSHYLCDFNETVPHLCSWAPLRESICFPDIQAEFINLETSFFLFLFFLFKYLANMCANFLENTMFLKHTHYGSTLSLLHFS